ncbi:hypothetical protein MSG28_008675 [Choristoneura fumiferana]|uniref:Uncharacterized protein n=1 Tax=Choristoneura fumiferana TaxID=7141 RepID=A0ACC0J7K4_CHOFU|nr:hypothetical protein MSG28_008675 [Choristoneura fumiferana]
MARWVVIVFGLLQICWPAACEENKYANYTLMKITPQNGEHLEELSKLQHVPESIEILKRSRGLNRSTDILVAPHKRAFLDEFVSRLRIPVQYKLNYGWFFQEASSQAIKKDDYNVFAYNAYEDMLAFINNLTIQFSNVVTVQNVGQSYEGRKMVLVKLSTNPNGSNPIIFIDAGHDCYGVDGNRNYGFRWGEKGISKDPCNPEIYAGPKEFSEPETQIVATIMQTYKDRIKLYVSLHTYGPYMVYPWGFTDYIAPEKWERLHNLARMVSDSVVRAGGHRFEVMSSGQWYPAAGGSCDYAYGVIGIPYAYSMELTENFEFIFPEELLEVVLPQFFEGFTTFSIHIRREFALKQYCSDVVEVINGGVTYDGRHLYEVIIHSQAVGREDEVVPVMMLEAGQEAGQQSVELALFIIEQLVACQEHNEMIEKIRWVILPCTNPDGMEYSRYDRPLWRKNTKAAQDGLSFGVDVSRNFETQWGACERVTNGYSAVYPGVAAVSENETIFVKNALLKYKKDMKAYLSIRRNGHAIMYPYAYAETGGPPQTARIVQVAGNIAKKINQRGSSIQVFLNDSIYNVNGEARCGHSVDYTFDLGVPLTFEMRVYHGADLDIISKFQPLPTGYLYSLRHSYFSGIRELYSAVIEELKTIKENKIF